MSIRILVADDHTIFREGLISLLNRRSDTEVIGWAEKGRVAVLLARELRPEVVIMDASMPGLNGVEATAKILAEAPDVKVLALSMHADRRFVRRMLAAGAKGYLTKENAFEDLGRAIDTVLRNHVYLCPEVTSLIAENRRGVADDARSVSWAKLSLREREVVQLLAEGKSTHQIATCLYISAKTVETHRGRVMKKLKLRSIAELTKFAIREGLTSL